MESNVPTEIMNEEISHSNEKEEIAPVEEELRTTSSNTSIHNESAENGTLREGISTQKTFNELSRGQTTLVVKNFKKSVVTPLRLSVDNLKVGLLPPVLPLFESLPSSTSTMKSEASELIKAIQELKLSSIESHYVPKRDPPIYKGPSSIPTIQTFIKTFREYVMENQLSLHSSLVLLGRCLQGRAHNWWLGYQSLLRQKVFPEVTLEQVLVDLLSHYTGTSTILKTREALEDIHQEDNECIADYIARFAANLAEYPKELSEVDQVYYLVKGVSSIIRNKIDVDQIETLSQLKKKLFQFENKIVKVSNNNNKSYSNYSSSRSRDKESIPINIIQGNELEYTPMYEENSIPVNVIQASERQSHIKDPFSPSKTWNPRERESLNYNKNIICYRCNGRGHIMRHCALYKEDIHKYKNDNKSSSTNNNNSIVGVSNINTVQKN